jgi:hypothetical protein
MNVPAVTVAIDHQVIDGGVGRQARDPGFERGRGQAIQIADGEPGFEWPELAPRDAFVFLV